MKKQMNYSLKQLKVFVTVAQEKSFSRAGERIGLSQSAVSHSVKELENHTGVRLLDRTTREVVLTDAGQQLALRLERLLDELNSTLRDTGRMGQQLSGKVRVAASQTISAHLIPQCIAESHRRYPDIQFVLHDRPQQWVMESIRQEMSILASSSIQAQWAICNVKRFFPSLSFCFAIAIAFGRGRLCPLAGITGSEIGVAGLRVRQPTAD